MTGMEKSHAKKKAVGLSGFELVSLRIRRVRKVTQCTINPVIVVLIYVIVTCSQPKINPMVKPPTPPSSRNDHLLEGLRLSRKEPGNEISGSERGAKDRVRSKVKKVPEKANTRDSNRSGREYARSRDVESSNIEVTRKQTVKYFAVKI